MFRRNFLQQFMALTLSTSVLNACDKLNVVPQENDNNWQQIAESFESIRNQKIINFNTGSAAVLPDFIFEDLAKVQKRFAYEPPYEVWDELKPVYKNIKIDLAQQLNVSNEEVALVRNCTEALNNIIFGIDLKESDKVVISKNEYPFLINAIKQRKKREKFRLTQIDFELNDSNQKIIDIYRQEIERDCSYLILSYIDYHSGRIFPIKEIIKIAKKNNVKVIVDAAHSFGMIPQDLKSLDVDFYATSLHKWFNAPLGNGLLYVKKKWIKKTYSLLSNIRELDDKIEKFEVSGTKDYANIFGIAAASSFLKSIGGIEAKEKRLKELTDYAYKNLNSIEGINFLAAPKNLCAIISFKFQQLESKKLKKILNKEYGIHIKSVHYKQIFYLRLSNNLFITKKDIDYLISSIIKILNVEKD